MEKYIHKNMTGKLNGFDFIINDVYKEMDVDTVSVDYTLMTKERNIQYTVPLGMFIVCYAMQNSGKSDHDELCAIEKEMYKETIKLL